MRISDWSSDVCSSGLAAIGGGLALLKSGDKVRIDLNANRVDVLIPEAELEQRRAAWQPPELINQTPWEEIYRGMIGQHGTGACLEPATLYLNILEPRGEARNTHSRSRSNSAIPIPQCPQWTGPIPRKRVGEGKREERRVDVG